MRGRALRVIGLLSGTSMDGIDAALVRLRGSGPDVRADLIAFRTFPFAAADRKRLAAAAGPGRKDAEERARLHVRMGELSARAAIRLSAPHGGIEKVDLIGSHGQTLLHLPSGRERASVQVGDGTVIAERTGVPTVFDFRAADLAAGGEGAPILAVTDYLLFRSARVGRVLLNIGGIANVTLLPANASWEETIAFDTGPGNGLIDRIARLASGGKRPFDRGGRWAAGGKVDSLLLASLMEHPFLRRRPPKTTGTEVFGDALARALWKKARRRALPSADLLATVTAFTARTVGREVRRRTGEEWQVFVGGGGACNRFLMEAIQDEFRPRIVRPVDHLGFPSGAREAVGFALLAGEFAHGNRYPLRRVTGGGGEAPLGVLAPGGRPLRLTPIQRKEK